MLGDLTDLRQTSFGVRALNTYPAIFSKSGKNNWNGFPFDVPQLNGVASDDVTTVRDTRVSASFSTVLEFLT